MTALAPETASEASPSTGSTACPSCGSSRLEVFHEQRAIPIHSCRLVTSREEALGFRRGSLRLAMCGDCGFITNVDYDASVQDYSVLYEETQGFSPRFRSFADNLARSWVDKYALRDKTVLEIGCGKGEFLAAMCDAGAGHGIGIDPSIVAERIPPHLLPRLTLLNELYGKQHTRLSAEAIVCRHTLEHVGPVAAFMRLVHAAAVASDSVVLFELPDVLRVLREGAFWDIYYEHCSYFTPGSLARLFRGVGFAVLDVSLAYDDQYILLEARPERAGAPARDAGDAVDTVEEVAQAVGEFRQAFANTVTFWQETVLRAERPVIWGGGSKGVAFLTTLGVGDRIELAVDINPYKHGKFIAGSGHEVVAPEALRTFRPDLVIAMNAVYLDEIRATLDGLGVEASLVAV